MKDKTTKEFAATMIIVFLALSIMLIYTFHSFYANSVRRIEESSKKSLESQKARIENYLNKGIDVLWVTADTVEYMMENGADTEEILRYLTTEAEHEKEEMDENFTGIYGYIQGEYLDGIGWVPPQDYVPQEREWYVAARKAGGKPTIVAPYLDAQTHTIMISVSKLLNDGESVLSFDIALNEVQTIAEDISVDDMGYGFIMDETGLVIAHLDEHEKGKIYPETKEQEGLVSRVFSNGESQFRTLINGEECSVFSEKIMDDWYVVMIVSSEKLFGELKRQILVNALVCVCVFIVVAVFCAMAYQRIHTHQERDRESRQKLDVLSANIVRALAYTIDAKDRYTSGHSLRVAAYSMELAKRMGKSQAEQRMIHYAGLLHDVGKIRVTEEVINKTGKLTEEELNQIKLHPVSGYHILKDIYEDKIIATGAKYHHERYDGKGYPNGLAGENIPEIARIIGVADAYDAMTSNRSYREALPREVVRDEIEINKGKQFDPKIADIMLQMIDEDTEYKMRQTDSSQKYILIAANDPNDVSTAEEILKEDETYRIVSAGSGGTALELLKRRHIDLILLDLYMPDMDGFELFEKIRSQYSIPVIIMAADKSIETIQKANAFGIDDYVAKPFLPAALRETVYGIINSWR